MSAPPGRRAQGAQAYLYGTKRADTALTRYLCSWLQVELLKSVETLLDAEKDKVSLDRRDNQMLKAQLASLQSQGAGGAGVGLPGGSAKQ